MARHDPPEDKAVRFPPANKNAIARWICPKCGAANLPARGTCRRCGLTRPQKPAKEG